MRGIEEEIFFLDGGGGGEELAQVEVEIMVDDVGFYSGTLLMIRPRQRAKTTVSKISKNCENYFGEKLSFTLNSNRRLN